MSQAKRSDALLARAVTLGGELVKAGQTVFWGGYSGYFRDIDGHLWEVAFKPFAPFDATGHLICRTRADPIRLNQAGR